MEAPMMRRLRRAALLSIVAAMLAACDNGNGSPTDPTPANPTPADRFRGRTGISIPAAFEERCTPKTPAWGLLPPTVLAQGTITRDGSGWVWRIDSTRGGGDMQINLSSTGMTETEMTLGGTAQGTANDMLSALRFANPDRVNAGSGSAPATVIGTFSTQLNGVTGRMNGTLAFTDNQGGVTTCTETMLFLFLLDR